MKGRGLKEQQLISLHIQHCHTQTKRFLFRKGCDKPSEQRENCEHVMAVIVMVKLVIILVIFNSFSAISVDLLSSLYFIQPLVRFPRGRESAFHNLTGFFAILPWVKLFYRGENNIAATNDFAETKIDPFSLSILFSEVDHFAYICT